MKTSSPEITLAVLAHGDDEVMIGHAMLQAPNLITSVATDGEATTLDYQADCLCLAARSAAH